MQRTFWNAFKNFAILFSFIMNFVLLVIVLILGTHLFSITDGIVEPLVDGLHESFVGLDEATIIRQIAVQDQIPVEFTLLVEDSLDVIVTRDVRLTGPATFNLPAGGGTISGTVIMTLYEGQALPVSLSLPVEVNEMVPVNLLVDVEIPLSETELHEPFYKLRTLMEPFVELLDKLPGSWPKAVDVVLGRGADE